MYVADQSNNRIQKFVGGSATGTAVTNLTLSNPCDLYVDNNNVLYILDTSNYRVLRWSNNVVTVVAGGFGAGSTYDKMSTSYSMFIDASYNIYVSDYGNHRVALWSAGYPNMSQLVAGGYGAGSTPDKLYNPMGIYVDSFRTIYIADYYNHRIQQWNANAIIGITVAGTTAVSGSWSYLLYYPTTVIYDQHNYLYILDSGNNRIQRWVPGASYGITVVASSSMSNPRGLNFDSSGNMIVADMSSQRIISFAISCQKVSYRTLADRYKISIGSVSNIIKRKVEYIESYEQNESSTKKRNLRDEFSQQHDQQVYEWFAIQRSKNIPVSGPLLQERARQIRQQLGGTAASDFKASNGWLEKFRIRHNIQHRIICGESAAVDPKTVDEWKKRLPSIIEQYDPNDVYNADETGLFFKALPDRSLVMAKEACKGGKRSKERFTVLLCTNMTGTD
ncbi:unnamed protein product [Rotaria magnacalcarata]|uniref:HTH CENPB-type domain-containing protein n=2 Tax=Rotaria magnacalcarata TaxID=392030 RepID=A0A816BWC8_9BILA|nr:unnamed protein product [Rotaria magnacalcarata]